ncbi:MAG: PspC domain-containing protein [Balneolaceae bacterium]|nr:PspC domain-containing protein [Balneolaceae bacterium]
MSEQTKDRASRKNLDSMLEFDDHELQTTMQEFLKDEKKASNNIWNFATIAGIAMFFVGMFYLIQSIGLSIGPNLSGLVEMMPLVGGILVTLVGFGFLVGDRSKKKEQQKKKRSSKKRKEFDFDAYMDMDEDADYSLDNDLEEKYSGKSGKKGKSRSGSLNYDFYALHQPKRLYKSRTDKKWAGVCGGLAKYFGISSTVIRLLFIVTFFAGSGTSLLVYIALAIALDKEPPELMDDFDY